eukprot:scaffold6970_cov82-Skeletonema_dohrnii-CCMP3373.AAC.2
MNSTDFREFDALTSAIEKKIQVCGGPHEKISQINNILKIIANLRREIKAQEQLIENLVNLSRSHQEEKGEVTTRKNIRDKHYMMKAEQLKKLHDLYDELLLTVERWRTINLVGRHRELHPLNKEVCPICLEDVPITCLDSVEYFWCCGNFICFQCFQASFAGGQLRMKNCPCCREEIFVATEEKVRQTEQLAKRGRPWAQAIMGERYLYGSSIPHEHHKVDVQEALKWLKLAAEQNHPDAIRMIAQLHHGVYGKVKEVEQCHIKARVLLKEAADLGNLKAQRNYAMMCRLGQGGPDDKSEAAHYYTLAYSQKGLSFEKDEIAPLQISDDLRDEVLHAGLFLGIYHFYGDGGLTRNVFTAKYYLEEHVKECEKQCAYLGSDSYMYLAACLMELQERTFGRNITEYSIPGYSSVPRAISLYWKAVKLGIDSPNKYAQHSREVLKNLLSKLKRFCGHCGVASEDIPEGMLKACGRCHSTWYCGKECQTEHWKAGHKRDCVRQQV